LSTLVLEPLVTTLEQGFNLKLSRRYQVGCLKIYLYMHNAPTGTFIVNLKRGASLVVSKSFTSADIKTAMNTTDNYAHVFYPIIFSGNIMLEKGSYDIELTSTGYTYNDNAYLGWCKEYDVYNQFESEPINPYDFPYGFRILTIDNRELI